MMRSARFRQVTWYGALTALALGACTGGSGELAGDQIVATRPPVPTPIPGPLSQRVTEIAGSPVIAETAFLGWPVYDWLNLGVSFLIILVGYILGTWLLRWLLNWIVSHSTIEFGREVLAALGPQLRWLVVVMAMNVATTRLTFLSPATRRFLVDAYFVTNLVLISIILWRLIDVVDHWFRHRLAAEKRLEEMDPALLALQRLAHILLTVITGSVLLSHFGINVSALAATLGVAGLAVSLAARNTIADAIAGIIILIDRPFRIGDRIGIQEIDTWGDVVEIGLRSTRIRTQDNRMVIVPNSNIGANQIVNYSYPDPKYRVEIHVGIGYERDIEVVRALLIDAVRQIDGVLPDKPVEALYVEMGDSAMIFRVRWWIESYVDTRRMFDRANTAIQYALYEHGIDIPYPVQTTHLQVDGQTAVRLARVFRNDTGME